VKSFIVKRRVVLHMATTKTAEDDPLITMSKRDSPQLRAEVRADIDGRTRTLELDDSVYAFYAKSADTHEARPRSRGDVTTETAGDLADRIIGHIVAEGEAERRSDITLQDVTLYERSAVMDVSKAYVPTWHDDWPESGSKSKQVRFILENEPAFSDEEIAAGVGCSRSLVADVKDGLDA
jgi:hypothetical protein